MMDARLKRKNKMESFSGTTLKNMMSDNIKSNTQQTKCQKMDIATFRAKLFCQ